MLARENRLLKAEDFRSTMKLGRKVASNHLVIYLKRDEDQPQARFGFVVAKSVGGAVRRNLVKRRLRAIAREFLASNPATIQFSVVVRALPGAAEIDWDALKKEFLVAAETAMKKAVGQ